MNDQLDDRFTQEEKEPCPECKADAIVSFYVSDSVDFHVEAECKNCGTYFTE